MNRKSLKNRKGFTLVELLVAITLFSIAVSVAVGGFVRALRTQRQLIGLISANSNASLAIEEMARELRTSRNFQCLGGLSPCEELSFRNAIDENVTYRLGTDPGGTQYIERGSGGSFQQMTAANVRVETLLFNLFNNAQYPPRITITVEIGATASELAGSVTRMQTTVSSRVF